MPSNGRSDQAGGTNLLAERGEFVVFWVAAHPSLRQRVGLGRDLLDLVADASDEHA